MGILFPNLPLIVDANHTLQHITQLYCIFLLFHLQWFKENIHIVSVSILSVFYRRLLSVEWVEKTTTKVKCKN